MRAPKAAAVGCAAALMAALLSSCAYTSGLLPGFSTNPSVYFAVNDVLVSQQVPVLTYPSCVLEADQKTQTCTGETLDRQPISAVADQSDEALPLTIKIGEKVIFEGSATEVVTKGAEAK